MKIMSQVTLNEFLNLPRRAQELFFEIMISSKQCAENPYTPFYVCGFPAEIVESPIEAIFYMAFISEAFRKGYSFDLIPQAYIATEERRYRADFLFTTDDEGNIDKFDNAFHLIIECDGHEFHERTKQQVTKGNDRDLALKKAGYDVLHFSGSQIYNDPLKCAENAVNYIISRVFNS